MNYERQEKFYSKVEQYGASGLVMIAAVIIALVRNELLII